MFRQHKILCENKETVIYLFLYDQQIDLDTMKNIFSQISNMTLESRIIDYFNQHNIKCLGIFMNFLQINLAKYTFFN